MITGSITIYRCDGVQCDEQTIVPDELEGQFVKEWFAGLDKHFCPSCRGRMVNQAAVLDQETRLRAIEQTVRGQIQTGKRRVANVH